MCEKHNSGEFLCIYIRTPKVYSRYSGMIPLLLHDGAFRYLPISQAKGQK